MNSMRGRGLAWFGKNVSELHPPHNGHIKVSRYYTAARSWTSSEVWWFDIPLEEVGKGSPDHIHLLCQKSVSSQDFFHLEVPKSVFQGAVSSGCVEIIAKRGKQIIRLHLSARPMGKFVDIRWKGPCHLVLAQYLQ